MNRISALVACSVVALITLSACNGSSTNASDVSSLGAAPTGKAVCTSLANWQSVGVGMSASEVQARLGAPAQIVSTATSSEYHYERCRGALSQDAEAVAAVGTTPAIPAKLVTYFSSGVVVISGSRGVTSVQTPTLSSDIKLMICEWDLYNYPANYGDGNRGCRTASNPF